MTTLKEDFSRMLPGIIAIIICFLVFTSAISLYEIHKAKEFCEQNNGSYNMDLKIGHTCNGTKLIKIKWGEYMFKPNFTITWD